MAYLSLGGVSVSVDYATKDYEGFRASMLDLATQLLPEWTDHSSTDFGVVLVEQVAYGCEILSYYNDRAMNEGYLRTATTRRSVLDLATLLAYTPKTNVSATVALDVMISGDQTIPANFSVGTKLAGSLTAEEFVPLVSVDLVGAGTHSVNFIHGKLIENEKLGVSSGLPGQVFTLDRFPLAFNPDGSSSLVLQVEEGLAFQTWTRVEDFVDSDPTDRVFLIRVSEEDETEIIFSDGVNGKIPPSGAQIRAKRYRIGGGAAGNKVGPSTITRILNPSVAPRVTSVTNTETPTGGVDKETIDEIKVNAPRSLRIANDVLGPPRDYAAGAVKAGASAASAVRSPSNRLDLDVYITADNGLGADPSPSTTLKQTVLNWLTERAQPPVNVRVLDPEVRNVTVEVTVHALPTHFQSAVKSAAEEIIQNFFDASATVFGVTIPMSALIQSLENATDRGIDFVNLTKLHRTPVARALRMPGNATVSVDAPNANSVHDRWVIHFTSYTSFIVTGDTSGEETASGTVGAPYTTAGGELGFTVTAGTSGPQPGSEWEIVTGPILGNLNMEPAEVPLLDVADLTVTIEGGVLG